MNKTPRPYADVIKAWADGADVQYQIHDEGGWNDAISPSFSGPDNIRWRIKPDTITMSYRIALFKYDSKFYLRLVNYENEWPGMTINHPEFICWVGPWRTENIELNGDII